MTAPSEIGGAGFPTSREATELSDREYLGVVKSYNDRRGFGFVACAEMVARHGRDVYLPKAEAALAMAAAEPGERMAEGDVLRFRVRLSTEGYPQAAEVSRPRQLRGAVVRAPTAEAVGLLRSSHGQDVVVRPEAIGCLQLVERDEVSFYMVDDGASEASLVCLERSERPAAAVLGLCSVRLPREGRRDDMTLQLHAWSDRVVATGLPADVTEAELTHFFGKQGATSVSLARCADGKTFGAALFPGLREVSRLLGSPVHAFADDVETRVAALLPAEAIGEQPCLPSLPEPALAAGQEKGTLLISWTPTAIADRYVVELRVAGSEAAWSIVEDVTGNTCCAECGSCRVTGLPATAAYEARVSYATTCSTRSDPSDASEPCTAVPAPAPAPAPARPVAPPATWTAPNMTAGMTMPSGVVVGTVPSTLAGSMLGGALAMPGALPCTMPGGVVSVAAPNLQELAISMAQMVQPVGMPINMLAPAPGWQCPHGAPAPAAPTPEVSWADEAGGSVLVRWQPVAHAAAYVVELREAGGACERFSRAAPAVPGLPVDLQIGGLRPAAPGGCYVAQVRVVDAGGCESAPSAPASTAPWAAAPLLCTELPQLLHAVSQPVAAAPVVQQAQPEMIKVEQAALVPAATEAAWFGPLAAGLTVQAAATAGGSDFLTLD